MQQLNLKNGLSVRQRMINENLKKEKISPKKGLSFLGTVSKNCSIKYEHITNKALAYIGKIIELEVHQQDKHQRKRHNRYIHLHQ